MIKFYFFSNLYSSALYTFYLFLHNFSPHSLLYCALFHSDVQSNFLITLFSFFFFFFLLSHIERRREFESPPRLCPVHIHSFSHLRLSVASNTMTFCGNTTASFYLICLSPLTSSGLFEHLQVLSSSGYFSCSLN